MSRCLSRLDDIDDDDDDDGNDNDDEDLSSYPQILLRLGQGLRVLKGLSSQYPFLVQWVLEGLLRTTPRKKSWLYTISGGTYALSTKLVVLRISSLIRSRS